jgi:hypothetical protein
MDVNYKLKNKIKKDLILNLDAGVEPGTIIGLPNC